MDELNYLKKWLDRNIDEHTTAPIGEIDTKTLAEAIIKEGFSRRPEPLVRGMEIDVEALAEVIFKSQMKIAGLMNTWNQATPALKSIYIDQAKYYVANAHVWLKEKP